MHGAWSLAGAISLAPFPMNRPISSCTGAIFGQRNIKPSERAQGFRVLADKLVEWRKDDPSLKGVNTKTYLAEHFGVICKRTAQVLLNISKKPVKRGQ